jgi:phosphoribosylformylglycinamidine cyclo-ligase
MAHITGGGFAANLARVLPARLCARLDRGSWTPPAVFGLVGGLGGVDQLELERTLNMGVGMAAVVGPDGVDAALGVLAGRGVRAWVVGEVVAAGADGASAGAARLFGAHPS